MKNKNFDYFQSLVKMSSFALEEARYLKTVCEDFDPEKLPDHKDHLHNLEHACDMEKHEFTKALIREFLPPVERDDLFRLAHITDNLVDCVEGVVVFFYMADIRTLREDVGVFADLVISCCEKTCVMLEEFRNFKKMPEKLKQTIIELNDLEEKGDRLYMDAVRTLSSTAKTTREIIEWRDVYSNFEKCFDAAESIADNIESVILKNS